MQTASGARLASAVPTSSNKGTWSERFVARWCLLSPRDTKPTISTPSMLRNARAWDAPMFPQPTIRILNDLVFRSIVQVPPTDLPLPLYHRCGAFPGASFGRLKLNRYNLEHTKLPPNVKNASRANLNSSNDFLL